MGGIIGGILEILQFNKTNSDSKIIDAIYIISGKNIQSYKLPIRFINDGELKWIYNDDGSVNASIYKSILYKEVAKSIKSGALNLLYSDKYKSVNDYLIPESQWKENKEKYLKRANIIEMYDYEDHILYLKNILDAQYVKTNENEFLKIGKDNKIRVSTPAKENNTELSIQQLLGTENYIPLIQILYDIENSTNFSSSFTHFSRKSTKTLDNHPVICAAIVAFGCNIGIRKMGKISNGIGADKLEYTSRWYFSKENIDDANRKILSTIEKLSIPKIFQQKTGSLHTSSDGQKFNVSILAVNATHSYKYFGSGKGVAAYGFIDEKSRLFYNTVISASEREAAYVIDGLMFNEEVSSDIHSTDTHGYREVIFGVCNSLGIVFAPRIKNYKDQYLYTFRGISRSYYEDLGYNILPTKSTYIDEGVLYEQWDNILRLLCSIKLKFTMASKLFNRLNSYSNKHPLNQALQELGRIHKSVFILKYYDEVKLRQSIEKQLNKMEQSNQFAKAIFFGNNQELNYESKEEQEVAVSCRHLIQNSIILWNYLTISNILFDMSEKQRISVLDSIKNSSIMTWQHVNLLGEYDFINTNGNGNLNLEKILTLKI